MCTEFVLTLREDTLDFLSSLHKKMRNFTARNSDKPVLNLARSGRNQERYHLLVAMEMGFTSCHGVFGKAQELRYLRLCLNQDIFTGLKEPEHQEKYVSPPAKTEEMV